LRVFLTNSISSEVNDHINLNSPEVCETRTNNL
jgi:hypothetical protein